MKTIEEQVISAYIPHETTLREVSRIVGIDHRHGNKIRHLQNNHPTIKPIALMEYLIKMVTQKGGTVLDPFMGSGSTGIAAVRNGFSFIGIDMTAEYVEIANARINHEKKLNRLFEEV